VVISGPDEYDRREEYSEIDARFKQRWEEIKAKSHELVRSGQSLYRAMQGWEGIRDEEEWQRMLAVAGSDLKGGRFLVEALGAERYLAPEMVATLIMLRRGWIEEYGVQTAVELMLVDSAVIAFYNQMRAQRLVGNLFNHIEFEFFARDSPTAKIKQKYGEYAVKGYTVEYTAERLTQQMQPLLDRANRMLLRNIKALRDLKTANITVNVNAPSQVNLASKQLNFQGAAPGGDGE